MLEISGSALAAERQRAEVVAANMANANTTHMAAWKAARISARKLCFRSAKMFPFQLVLNQLSIRAGWPGARRPSGFRESSMIRRLRQMRYEPGHPDANDQGYVAYPSINPIQEMVDLMGAVRAYQLNASAVNASKQTDPAVSGHSEIRAH